MTDYFEAYLEQFTIGCGCPNCRNYECFSSPNFKYKTYDSNQIQEIAEKMSKNPYHLCEKLSPIAVDPLIIEDLAYFNEFANSVISNKENIDFRLFEKIIKSPKTFYMLFLDFDDMNYYNFSFDEELLISFLDKAQNTQKLNKYKDNLISLSSTIFLSSSLVSPHMMRGVLLITLFLSIFDIPKVSAISHFFNSNKTFSDQFYNNMIQYRKLTERHVKFLQNLISNACQRLGNPKIISGNQEIYRMVEHIQKISNINQNKGFPINPSIFKNEYVSSILDREEEIHSLLLSRKTLLDFPSFITIKFKKIIQERILCIIKETRSQEPHVTPYLIFKIDRNAVLQDTIIALNDKKRDQLQKPIKVIFTGEKGDDSGSLTCEYFHIIFSEFFSPNLNMFDLIDNKFYWFKQKCLDLERFKNVGILVGLAIHNSKMIPIRFPMVLFKKLLKQPLSIFDLYELKPEVATSLQWILDNQFDASELNLFFEVTVDDFGEPTTKELIPNGSKTAVTKDNCERYVNCIINWELNESISKQFDSFKSGFWLVLQIEKTVTFFEPVDLDLILSGQTVYNWEELIENTTYSDGYTADSETIQLFWAVFNEFSQENKIDFLMFLTGTKSVPMNGLKEIHLEIQKSNDISFLPVAYTCSEILQLPDYRDFELLKKNLLICIENNNQFHLI